MIYPWYLTKGSPSSWTIYPWYFDSVSDPLGVGVVWDGVELIEIAGEGVKVLVGVGVRVLIGDGVGVFVKEITADLVGVLVIVITADLVGVIVEEGILVGVREEVITGVETGLVGVMVKLAAGIGYLHQQLVQFALLPLQICCTPATTLGGIGSVQVVAPVKQTFVSSPLVPKYSL